MWEFALVVQLVFYQWALGGRLASFSPMARAAVGMAGVVVVGVVVYVVARRTRQDFEQVEGPRHRIDPPPPPRREVLGFPLHAPEPIRDPNFWAHAKDSTRLLSIHVAAGAALFGGLIVWTIPRALHHDQTLLLHPWFVRLAGAQLVLVLLLLASYGPGWGWGSAGFRWAPPVVVATAGVALTTGFFSGFTLWLAHRLGLAVPLDYDQSAAFGVSAMVGSLAVIAWVGFHVWGARAERRDLELDSSFPLNTAPPGREPNGASPSMRRRVALLRSFSECITRIDWIMTPAVAAFVVTEIVALFVGRQFPTVITKFGAWLLTVTVGVALPALLFRAFRPNARSKVKIIWDATTFWPRRFHPFAVRPYAERAVPEIQGRLYEEVVTRHRRVVVAAHSQGTVLAYCALTNLAEWRRIVTLDVALVTFGCPLVRMHARFFPASFRLDDFRTLSRELFTGNEPCRGWSNVFRRTDYVGQALFTGTDLASCDRQIPDPPQRPSRDDLPLDRPEPVPPDASPPIWTKTVVHSYYNNSVELREWVDGPVKAALRGAGDATRPT